MRVVWTPEALMDRGDIWGYIAVDNPRAATRMDELLAMRLADWLNTQSWGGQVGFKEPAS